MVTVKQKNQVELCIGHREVSSGCPWGANINTALCTSRTVVIFLDTHVSVGHRGCAQLLKDLQKSYGDATNKVSCLLPDSVTMPPVYRDAC